MTGSCKTTAWNSNQEVTSQRKTIMFTVFTYHSTWFSHFDWLTKQLPTLITWDKECFFCHLIKSTATYNKVSEHRSQCWHSTDEIYGNLSVFWVLILNSWESCSEALTTLCLGFSACKVRDLDQRISKIPVNHHVLVCFSLIDGAEQAYRNSSNG